MKKNYPPLIGTILYFLSIGLWFILLASLFFWSLPVLLLVYLLGIVSTTFSRKALFWPAFRNHWVWKWFRESYFEYTVEGPGKEYIIQRSEGGPSTKDNNSSMKRKIMYAIYPHGTLPVSTFFYFCTNGDQFPTLITCIHSAVFKIPFLRDVAQWLNCTTVTKEDIIEAIRMTDQIAINPGGVGDIAYTDTTTVCQRRGFLCIAKEEKCLVVPIWIPQERSFFSVFMPLGRVLEPYLGYPFPLFIWPIFPRKLKTVIRVGNAIDMGKPDFSIEDGFKQFYEKELPFLQTLK